MLDHEIKVKLNRNPTPNVNNKWEKMAEYSSHFHWYILHKFCFRFPC